MKVAHRREQIIGGEPVRKRARIALAQDSDRSRHIGSPARTLQALVEKATQDGKWPGSARAATIIGLSVALWAVLIVGAIQLAKQLG